MKNQDVVVNINSFLEKLDFVSAVRGIEENLHSLERSKKDLHKTGSELYELIKQKDEGFLPTLTRKDINVFYTINMYANKFDIRGIREIVKANTNLWARDHITHYLSEDAKGMLQSMSVIPRDEYENKIKQPPSAYSKGGY